MHHAKGFERLSSHGTLRHNVRARFYASVQSLLLFSSTLYIAPPCQCSLYPSLILAVITLHYFCVTRSIDFFFPSAKRGHNVLRINFQAFESLPPVSSFFHGSTEVSF